MPTTTERLHVKIIGWSLIAVLLYTTVELSAWGILKAQLFDNGRTTRLERLSSVLDDKQKQAVLSVLTDENFWLRIDDDLGWVAPIRSPGEHTKKKAEGTTRIVAFGDSFTYGDEVEMEETWPFLLEDMLPGIEVLNFGVPAYGLDQAYLRYRLEGKEYDHDILIIGFIIEDEYRNVHAFNPFKLVNTGVPYAKPRFVLENEQLRLIPSPLRRVDYPKFIEADCATTASGGIQGCSSLGLGIDALSKLPSAQVASLLFDRTTWLEIPKDEKANSFNLTTKIFSEFYREAQANGVEPLILLMPTRANLLDESMVSSVFAAYEEFFEAHDMRFLNVTPELHRTDPLHSVWRAWGHYSKKGNSIVASAVRTYLENEGFLTVSPEPSTPLEHTDVPKPNTATVQYRYVQWEITKKRSTKYVCVGTHCVQASQFTLLLNGNPVSWPDGTTASNPGGGNPSGEGAANVVNGTNGKWLDYHFSNEDEGVQTGKSAIIIDTGTGNSITFNGYRWTTANDEPGRDPMSWNIYGSQDGTSWVLLDVQTDKTITSSRNTYTSDFTINAQNEML